ncbi:SH3 domain-containing protein [Marinobacter sp. TBZ242]|uniref:SH3 domain-containing protein n=1 Tax=Marinobacter azerbaijanicus TaxID=3050455 RepID=A0ABT7I7Y7_9GAMM|nr:SH3 domain-containing protein [Marinobacter sp. TBZ242]MDL0429808.1 SH3 domain-containing protein [Marinobacter sp. TBZ242]
MKHTLIVAILATASFTMSSCRTMETVSKEDIGTVAGAIGGAWVGHRVGGDNKTLATAVGAAGGALIGRTIGRMLDERDRQRLSASTHETIRTGQPRSWHNPETGVSAKTSVKQTTTQQEQTQVRVLKGKVKEVPPLEFIGEEYSPGGNVNVRGGPGTDYVVVDTLRAGEHINVVGKVKDKPWYMVSRGGVGSGFVYSTLLTSVPEENRTGDANQDPVPESQVQRAAVSATRDCRVVTQEVTLDNGKTTAEEVTACRGPDGWEIV